MANMKDGKGWTGKWARMLVLVSLVDVAFGRYMLPVHESGPGPAVDRGVPILPGLHLARRAEGAKDPCTELVKTVRAAIKKNQDFVPASAVYACITNVPFDSEDASANLKEVTKFSQIISTQAFYKDPPNPDLDTAPVDLQGRLAVIEAKTARKDGYPNLYEYHKELFELFGSFNDGHVFYNPTCAFGFGDFYHDHPLVSIAKDQASVPKVHVLDPATRKIGEEIVKIAGEDAKEYLHNLVHNMPDLTFTDPDSRFNILMSRQTIRDFERGIFAERKLFEEDFEMETASGKKIKVEWKVQLKRSSFKVGFADTDSFTQKICRGLDLEGPPKASEPVLESSEIPQGTTRKVYTVQGSIFPGLDAEPSYPVPTLKSHGNELTLHQLDPKTAVLGIHYFKFWNLNETAVRPVDRGNYWVETLLAMKANLKAAGVERLIIDVSSNGGGMSSLSILTHRHFFPKDAPYYGMNWRATELGRRIFNLFFRFEINTLRKVDGVTKFEDGDALFKNPVTSHGDKFTPIARFDPYTLIRADLQKTQSNTETIKDTIEEKLDAENFLPASDILILSDGLCASACTTFVESMRDSGVRTLVHGGRPYTNPSKIPTQQALGGVKGLEVKKFSEVASDLSGQQHLAPDDIPSNLTQSIDIGATTRNSYAPDGTVPLEFVYRPANFRIQLSEATWGDQKRLWEEARDTAWDEEGDPRRDMFDDEKLGRLHEESVDVERETEARKKGKVSGVYTGGKKLAWHILDGLNLKH